MYFYWWKKIFRQSVNWCWSYCVSCCRVKLLSVPERGEQLFFSVLVRFIDLGHEKEVKSYQILLLPEQFHSLPGQAVEIIVCRVKPADNESEWHPKVSCSDTQTRQQLLVLSHPALNRFSEQVSISAWTHTSRGVKTQAARSDCNSGRRRGRRIIPLVGAAV